MWRTLEQLKLEHREIIALKYPKGYDYNTLSAVLSIPRGTVMSRLFHARMAFQAAYNDESLETGRNGGQGHGEL